MPKQCSIDTTFGTEFKIFRLRSAAASVSPLPQEKLEIVILDTKPIATAPKAPRPTSYRIPSIVERIDREVI